MRILAVILLSLVAAAATFVAGFAVLHGIKAPERETTDDTAAPRVPDALTLDLNPIDRRPERVAFAGVVDASATRQMRLSGRVKIAGAQRLVLRALSIGPRVLAETKPDASGHFEFEALPGAAYELRVLGARGVPIRTYPRLDLFADRELDIVTTPQNRVRVRVLLGDKPVPKALVILERDGRRIASGTSDAKGNLEVESLSGGPLKWRVWTSGGSTPTKEWNGTAELGATESSLQIELGSG